MQLDERPWLAATFTGPQLNHMRGVLQRLGGSPLDGLLVGPADRVVFDLGALVGWFDNPRDHLEYAVPILRHLIELLGQLAPAWSGSIEHLHFSYQAVMQTAYKLRDEPGWLDLTVWAARSQVAISPTVAAAMRATYYGHALPRHVGYERLAILADKAGDDREVIRICEAAQAEGWSGSWDKRLAKAHKRLGDGG